MSRVRNELCADLSVVGVSIPDFLGQTHYFPIFFVLLKEIPIFLTFRRKMLGFGGNFGERSVMRTINKMDNSYLVQM